MVERKTFGEYELVIIKDQDLEVSITTLGATITNIKYQNQELTLGYDNPDDYLKGTCFLGATIGRYANRIKDASFVLNNQKYQLTINEHHNQLHGGNGFDKKKWDLEIIDDNQVSFKYLSKDGEEGYPGNLEMKVNYLILDNKLRIEFEGISDQDTIFGPTNHTYFNLGDNVLNYELIINSDEYLETDNENIPTIKKKCEGLFDFHELRKIENNYDHCFVLKDEFALSLKNNNLQIDVYTDFPGIQVYTGEFLTDGFKANEGIALEAEFFPNSPNRSDFPSPILRKNTLFKKYVEYQIKSS